MTTAISRPLESPCDDSGQDQASNLKEASHGVFKSLAQLLCSNALVGITGLACLPLLFRNLGAATYGQLSLFLLFLGLLSSLDIARPTLVVELSSDGNTRRVSQLQSLAGVSQCLLVPIALALGIWILGPSAGIALAIAIWLFIAASTPYAILAARGRVGVAAATRNYAWAAAFIVATALSFGGLSVQAYLWPFAVANLIILVCNRRLAGPEAGPIFIRPRLELFTRFRARSLDIILLSLATAVLVSADKLILKANFSEETFGQYSAQYDLAIKINILSTALGTVLFPAFSRLFAKGGLELAGKRFVRQLSWIVTGYFLVLVLLLIFSEEVLRLVLGAEALTMRAIYPLMLFGIFLALFGHLITPWQRACGDFRTHRRIYSFSAVLMVLVGLIAIPLWGPPGAVLTFLVARVADLLLIASEVIRLPRPTLGLGRIAALGLMIIALGTLAGYEFMIQGGLA